jgi:hypothetical protein
MEAIETVLKGKTEKRSDPMKAKIEHGKLVISLPLQEPKLSKSGKALVVATSRGVRQSTVKLEGKSVQVNANAFIYVDGRDVSKPSQQAATQGHGKGTQPYLGKTRSEPVELDSEIESRKQKQTRPKARPKDKGRIQGSAYKD